ncbi:MAG: response regulator [Planctomycetota bacterium]
MVTPRILVVDDDPDVTEYMTSFLGDEGYEMASAENATVALSKIEEFHPDAILIDVLMPGRSGLDLLVTIRQDPRWCDIPLVVITGNDKILEDDCQSYLGSCLGVRGPDGTLGKPVDRATLLAVLRILTGPDRGAIGNEEPDESDEGTRATGGSGGATGSGAPGEFPGGEARVPRERQGQLELEQE